MQSPTPANADNVQRQLAIFDVVRRAPGKSLAEVKAMLTKAFAERGLPRQPELWLDAVASEAAYGKPYIVDLPSAVAADSITSAPDPRVENILRERRDLRLESTEDQEPARTGAAAAGSNNAAAGDREVSNIPRFTPLGFLAAAAAIALAATVARKALRRSSDARARALPLPAVAREWRRGARRHA